MNRQLVLDTAKITEAQASHAWIMEQFDAARNDRSIPPEFLDGESLLARIDTLGDKVRSIHRDWQTELNNAAEYGHEWGMYGEFITAKPMISTNPTRIYHEIDNTTWFLAAWRRRTLTAVYRRYPLRAEFAR